MRLLWGPGLGRSLDETLPTWTLGRNETANTPGHQRASYAPERYHLWPYCSEFPAPPTWKHRTSTYVDGQFQHEQCEALQRGTKLVLSTDEATAIKLMLKQFMTIIHTGASVLWFTKIQHHGPADVKVSLIPVVPTTEAMVAMLNPVMNLGAKTPKAPKKKRIPSRQVPITAAAQLAQLTAVPFIGPVQPRKKLVLPRPDPLALQGLSTALATCAADDIILDVHNLGVQARSFCTLLPGVWLDDQIIHAHLALLQMRNPSTMYLNLVLSQHLPPPQDHLRLRRSTTHVQDHSTV